jgi:hypothetical protein
MVELATTLTIPYRVARPLNFTFVAAFDTID